MKKALLIIFLILLIACNSSQNNEVKNESSNIQKIEEVQQSLPQEDSGLKEQTDPAKPRFTINSPKKGEIVEKAEFNLTIENTNYSKFLVFYDEKNSTQIGDSFIIKDLKNGNQTIEIRLLDKEKNYLDVKKVSFTLKGLEKKEEIKTESNEKESEEIKVQEEKADDSEAKSLGLDFEIMFPPDGFGVKGDLVAVRLVPSSNFVIGNVNTTHVPKRGYFKYKLNDKEWITVDSATFTVRNLDKGTNTVYVEMMRNNGTSYGIKRHVTFEARTIIGKR